jgi:asparagine synthase (glutamine-hydrolysing)
MCGIAGFYNLLTPAPDVCLTLMGNALAHRGPDAEGFFTDDSVGLAHRRLSIIDLSTSANQPMHSCCGRYVMVYNGEVYNYREIATEITRQNGLQFQTHSDSEVVIEAFALWGKDCVTHFNGMFVIVVYDKQDHKLYLMRDRIGIKPLFIFQKGTQLAFSSEIKALMAVPEIKSVVQQNTNAFSHFLHLGYIPQPQTAWMEIQKFPAGCTACYDGEKLSINPYWSAAKMISEKVMMDEEDATAQLKELLISSVKMRLVSDVPFGTFLSGGIDSSLVTAIAQSVNSSPLNTFSIGFVDPKYDESAYARAVAEHLGTKHHEFQVTEKEAMELIPCMNGIYDEPFVDSSAIPTLLVSKMAKQNVTMTLSGDGGDELFMGYGAYCWAERLQHPFWKTFHQPIAALFKHGNSRQKRIGELLRYKGNVHPSHIFSQEQYLFSIEEIGGMLTDQQTFPKFGTLEKFYPETSRQLSPSEQQAFFDLTHYLKDDLLVKVDRASMQYSLETRVPLLDYRVVEFALNLDPTLKYHNGVTKYLLKKILYQYLPNKLFDRPKRGFAVPLGSWMKGPLKPWVLDSLSRQSILKRNLVSPESVQLLLNRFYSGGSDYLYNRIWALVILHQ